MQQRGTLSWNTCFHLPACAPSRVRHSLLFCSFHVVRRNMCHIRKHAADHSPHRSETPTMSGVSMATESTTTTTLFRMQEPSRWEASGSLSTNHRDLATMPHVAFSCCIEGRGWRCSRSSLLTKSTCVTGRSLPLGKEELRVNDGSSTQQCGNSIYSSQTRVVIVLFSTTTAKR